MFIRLVYCVCLLQLSYWSKNAGVRTRVRARARDVVPSPSSAWVGELASVVFPPLSC